LPGVVGRSDDLVPQAGQNAFDHRLEIAALAAEMVVDGAAGHTELGRDRLHGCVGIGVHREVAHVRFFGLEETFSVDWYVSLRHRQRPESELAFVQADHETVPPGHRAPSRGVLINLEVGMQRASTRGWSKVAAT
jgi:hypothetical protein